MFQLTTETDAIRAALPPVPDVYSQWYEQWTGGGCTHRCDGATNVIADAPCSCSPEDRKCKPTTRVNFLLPDVPGVGVWRLESHGWNVATTFAGTLDVMSGRYIEGTLRLVQRKENEPGKPRKDYVLPFFDVATVNVSGLLTGEVLPQVSAPATRAALPAPLPPALPGPGEVENVAQRVETAESSSPVITQEQRKRLFAVAKEQGYDEDGLRRLVADVRGNDGSTSKMTVSEAERVEALMNGRFDVRPVVPETTSYDHPDAP
jgi:hypothetical protein